MIGGPFIEAGSHGTKTLEAIDGSLNPVSLFVDFGVRFDVH